MNPILPTLQLDKSAYTRVQFIYIEKAIPEGETRTHSWNRSLATNSSELRPVLRERALGIENSCGPKGPNEQPRPQGLLVFQYGDGMLENE